jgi:hypothetical protein
MGSSPNPKIRVRCVAARGRIVEASAMTTFAPTELHHRSADGIEVSLLWSRQTNALTVAVEDSRSGEIFELPAPADKALDVFEHPFAYAAAA